MAQDEGFGAKKLAENSLEFNAQFAGQCHLLLGPRLNRLECKREKKFTEGETVVLHDGTTS
jgi:hypothetical protein